MTSIEMLIEEMLSKGYFKESVTLTNIDHLQYKAEEMHKQEIIDAWNDVYGNIKDAEQYYQEKFGSGMSEKPTYHKDNIVQQVIDKFNQRSELGIKKYGTTLEENNNDDYFTHLQEELMDAILYIEKLKSIKYANR
jgi:hypothetical protein